MDDFACIPEQSISSAISTFIAQNRGAKNMTGSVPASAPASGWSAMLLYEVPYYFYTCKKQGLRR